MRYTQPRIRSDSVFTLLDEDRDALTEMIELADRRNHSALAKESGADDPERASQESSRDVSEGWLIVQDRTRPATHGVTIINEPHGSGELTPTDPPNIVLANQDDKEGQTHDSE